MRERLGFGVVLLALAVGVLVTDCLLQATVLSPLLAVLLGALALWEFQRLSRDRVPPALRRGALAAGGLLLIWPLAAWSPQLAALLAPYDVLLVSAVVALPAWALMRLRWWGGIQPEDLGSLGIAVLGVALTALPLALLERLLFLPHGVLWGLVVILASKLNDIGGYLLGSALGRRKLCPGISPNKTVEGSLGGLLLGVVGALVLVLLLEPLGEHVSPAQSILLGLLLGLATQSGDLLESAVKRSLGIKDSAALIPSFGGVLDLVDSLIFAVPVGYAIGLAWLT